MGAVCSNYRLLRAQAPLAECAAVLKADAYGLGAEAVGEALAAQGCRLFFVAHLEEGIVLRAALPAAAQVFVLHGPVPGSEREFLRHNLVPVLNTPGQIDAWRALARSVGRALPAILQVDSGMARLGLTPVEVDALLERGDGLRGIALRYLMSHLACAEEQAHPMNAAQLARFTQLRSRFPAVPASLANSSGIFLGPRFHFDLLRPGAALYGIAPVAGAVNPMRPVVRLQAGVIQVREIEGGASVGYGARYRAPGRRRIATIAAGYADGWLRSLSGRGSAVIDGKKLPMVGTVSMDTCALDVTDLPAARVQPGTLVDLICADQPVDAVAAMAGTIGYEILTSLGSRYRRRYIGGAQNDETSAHEAATSV
ncbi:MAG TPA: alanine racemase [Noviherbaspirillum sp.]|nr:alanine racemase [Noviherbaspirillum sp.]